MKHASPAKLFLFLALFATVFIPQAALAQHQAASDAAPCTVSPSAAPAHAAIRVTDASQAVLAHAALQLRCGATVLNGLTDDKGEAKFAVRPGRYTLLTRMPGFADDLRTVDLPPATAPLQVALQVGSATDVVNVTADAGFVPFASNAGSKTNALLVEAPQSISIVNEREMQARGVLTVNEALRYTPACRPTNTVSNPASIGSRFAGSPRKPSASTATACASTPSLASSIPSNWKASKS